MTDYVIKDGISLRRFEGFFFLKWITAFGRYAISAG
jgi:hypothetical protein